MVKVTLIRKNSRRESVYFSLRLIREEIWPKLKDKEILIKPNLVSVQVQKAATHLDQIRGILDFLKEGYQGKILIAEGAALGETFEGFENFGYFQLKKEYPFSIEFLDLNKTDFEEIEILKREKIKVSKIILDPSFYIISAAKIKTHDTVIATLSLKNLIVGMIQGKDKEKIHQGIKEINQNLLILAKKKTPDLVSLDGWEAMEGEGPVDGEMRELKIALASSDFLAADRVALEIMGIDSKSVGYLMFCQREKLGEYNLEKIKILGKKLKNYKAHPKFKMHSDYPKMLAW